jgi:hypothetical protein
MNLMIKLVKTIVWCYTGFMKRFRGSLSIIIPSLLSVLFGSICAFGQSDNNGSDLNPQFAAATKEISVGCGELLPNNVPGITEVMSLCGGRYAFKISTDSMFEGEFFTGSGKGQSLDLGAFNYRVDMSLDDLIASFYIGPAIQYSSGFNFGLDAGTAVWFTLSNTVALRGDLQLNLSPGVELFLNLSLVYRFDNGGGG